MNLTTETQSICFPWRNIASPVVTKEPKSVCCSRISLISCCWCCSFILSLPYTLFCKFFYFFLFACLFVFIVYSLVYRFGWMFQFCLFTYSFDCFVLFYSLCFLFCFSKNGRISLRKQQRKLTYKESNNSNDWEKQAKFLTEEETKINAHTTYKRIFNKRPTNLKTKKQ